ncbi:MAG TPA: SigE family RNA polymerase sigma factor [Ilumatobacteraceae bacterium]|nr:SigE family RNA polymerase sigma factor [Ilumatobacteraceae bacterium]
MTDEPATAPDDRQWNVVAPVPSFEALYASHFVEMVRLATLLVGQPEAARDIVQDAFVAMHPKWFALDHPAAYLRTSVVNRSRSFHRKQRSRRAAIERQQAGLQTTSELAVDHTIEALAVLPYRQRAAIVLRFYEQRSEAEIATALGCRPGTVGPLISRGLARLREEM